MCSQFMMQGQKNIKKQKQSLLRQANNNSI